MRAATISADITPNCDVYLVGYAGEERKKTAKGVHDAPLAVSLILEVGSKKYLFVTIDTLAISDDRVDIIKSKILKVLPLEKENIIINAIHSHSLPNGFMEIKAFDTPDNPAYFDYVCTQLINSLHDLDKKMVDVSMEIGTTKIHGFYSKRTDITKPFDDNAMLILFKNGKTPIASICNFNCHATVLGPKNMLISSDLIGSVRKIIEDKFNVTPVMVTGASGDISNRQYRQGNDFKELDRVSRGVGDILNSIDNYKEIQLDCFEMKLYDYHIEYDNTKFYDDYQKGIDEADSILSLNNISLDEWKMRTSEKLSLENKMKLKYIDFHVCGKVLKSNELTIVTFPGELASKFGLKLRSMCKTPYFLLIGYCDGYQGYFIEEEEYGSTYEAKASNTPKGETEKIVEKIGELL